MKRCHILPLLAAVVAGGPLMNAPLKGQEIRFVVTPTVLHSIDDRLFGQFLERASFGEPGPESALQPGMRKLQPHVVELLKQMRIPLIRFPGGSDVDYIDWRDMVSNVPGRMEDRPVTTGRRGGTITNNFGYDEYFALRDELGCQTILVVNLLAGMEAAAGGKPTRPAGLHAAGLVAYCNAPLGAKLPEGMPDWPTVRARNGHPKPYGVKLWQVGNETWKIQAPFQKAGVKDPKDIALACTPVLTEYIDLMRQVDPSIEIVFDGPRSPTYAFGYKLPELPEVRQRVNYLTFHRYGPYRIDLLERDGRPVAHSQLSPEDLWKILAATPGDYCDHDGQCRAIGDDVQLAREYGGYKVACTEWNWNGYGAERVQPGLPIGVRLASAIGAAGFLNGLMRNGDIVKFATQSMLVGSRWGLSAVHADPTGETEAYFFPAGQVTLLYSNHHGGQFLHVESRNVPGYEQPYRIGGRIGPYKKVAFVDAVATADDKTVFVHLVNRHFSRDLEVTINLSAFPSVGPEASHHWLTGRLNDEPREGQPAEVCRLQRKATKPDGKLLSVTLPARSVSVIEIPAKRTTDP